jgi:hypothetical protein
VSALPAIVAITMTRKDAHSVKVEPSVSKIPLLAVSARWVCSRAVMEQASAPVVIKGLTVSQIPLLAHTVKLGTSLKVELPDVPTVHLGSIPILLVLEAVIHARQESTVVPLQPLVSGVHTVHIQIQVVPVSAPTVQRDITAIPRIQHLALDVQQDTSLPCLDRWVVIPAHLEHIVD